MPVFSFGSYDPQVSPDGRWWLAIASEGADGETRAGEGDGDVQVILHAP